MTPRRSVGAREGGGAGPSRDPFPVRPVVAALAALLAAGALTAAAGATGGAGRAAERPLPAAQDTGRVVVRLLTFGPGERVWEKFGHNALWVRDPSAGEDLVYNWGIFDFEQRDFFVRLLTGRMRYRVARSSLRQTLGFYRNAGRTIRVQRLRLTPGQAREVARRADVARLPQNRHYAYDPFRDNCSTRIRDLLDGVLDGAIRRETDALDTGETYRSHTRRLLQRVEWSYLGIMAFLGSTTDRRLSAWDEMFLPVEMDDWLREVEVRREDGRRVALAGPPRTLYRSGRPPPPAEGPGFGPGWLAAGLAGGALLAALGVAGGRGRRRAGRGFLGLGTAWSLAAGLAGVVAVGGWLLTGHWYVHMNENVLQLQPLSLGLAALLPLAGRAAGARRLARGLAWATAGLALLGVLAQPLPGMDQVNAEILALAVPPHLGLAVGLEALRPRTAEEAVGRSG